MLYELDKSGVREQTARLSDPHLDAVGRASDAVLEAKGRGGLSAQKDAMLRLAEVVANTLGGVEQLGQIHGETTGEVLVDNTR